jgi:Leucine-rich repeat (LRR) protein
MADVNLPRILELLGSEEAAVVAQGVEVVVSLGEPAIFEDLLRSCRISDRGAVIAAAPLRHGSVVLRLIVHAPEGTQLHESLRREHITTLDIDAAHLDGVFHQLPALRHLRLVTDADTLPLLAHLPMLSSLSIVGDRLTSLPVALAALTSLESLRLQAACLDTLPDGLTALPALRSLSLRCRSLSVLPSDLSASLVSLHLDGLPITALPDRIAALSLLEQLTLVSLPDLTVLPDGLTALTALTQLDISQTALPVLPPVLDQMPALQEVTLNDDLLHDGILDRLDGGSWASVDTAVAAMALLAHAAPSSLDALLRGGELLPSDRLIRGYRFSGSPQAGFDHAWLSGLTLLPEDHPLTSRLSRLDLSSGLEPNPRPGDLLTRSRTVTAPAALIRLLLAPLSATPKIRNTPGLHRVPLGLERLIRLERLDLSGNQIIELPGSLPERLRWLDLSENPLLAFPDALLSRPRLRTLSLAKTRLIALPPSGWRSCRLLALDLSDNALQDLPPGLAQARTLTTLRVSSNRLHNLPDLSTLTRLTRLDLSDNQLSRLPDWLGVLPLVSLRADHNRICTLPDTQPGWNNMTALSLQNNALLVLGGVESLTHLETLDLSNNPLMQLPKDLSPLHRLTRLLLKGSQLVALPESLWHLPALAHLDASHSPITELVWAARTAPALRRLDLSGCPISISPMLRWMLQRRLGEGLQGL